MVDTESKYSIILQSQPSDNHNTGSRITYENSNHQLILEEVLVRGEITHVYRYSQQIIGENRPYDMQGKFKYYPINERTSKIKWWYHIKPKTEDGRMPAINFKRSFSPFLKQCSRNMKIRIERAYIHS